MISASMAPVGGVRAARDSDISFEAAIAALTQPLKSFPSVNF